MKFTAFLLGLLAVSIFSSRAVATTRDVEMPFEFTDGFIVVKATIDGRASVNLLVDSGAGVSVLDLASSRRLGVSLGRAETVRGVDTDCTAFHIAPITVTFSDETLTKIGMAMDLSHAEELCSQRIDGLLGMDFFAGRVVSIDYAARKIRILASKEEPVTGETLPIRFDHGVMCVPLSVNGSRPRWIRLDTGCNDALHWVVRTSARPSRSRDVSIGFFTEENAKSLTTVKLGGRSVEHVVTALHDRELFPGEAGLLGNGLLSRQRVTIDAIRGVLHLAPAQ